MSGPPKRPMLARGTWPAAATAAAGSVIVVPVGSTEQHGPHLPLSTDTDIAIAIAMRLASELPGALVAPAIAYGASGEHQAFAGTLSIGREVTEMLLVELGRSASVTFPRLLLLSTHGGNAEPVALATSRLLDEGRDVMSWSPRFGGDAHAGHVETSIMLAIDSTCVRQHDDVRGNTSPIEQLWPTLLANGVRAVSENGVLGDPASASAAAGERLLSAAVRELLAAVRPWLAGARRRP